MQFIKKYFRIALALVLAAVAALMFSAAYRQTHNGEYEQAAAYVLANEVAAQTMQSAKGDLGLANLFADAYADLFDNAAAQHNAVVEKYESAAATYGTFACILAVLAAGCAVWHAVVFKKMRKTETVVQNISGSDNGAASETA